MGGSCISRPSNKNNKYNVYNHYVYKPKNQEQISIHTQKQNNQPAIIYPCYQSTWNICKNMQYSTPLNVNNLLKLVMNSKTISEQINKVYIPNRQYNYDNQNRKYFYTTDKEQHEQQYKNIVQVNNKVCIKASLLQSLLMAPPEIQRIQINSQFQYLILDKQTILQPSEDTTLLKTVIQSAFVIELVSQKQYNMKYVSGNNLKNIINSYQQQRQLIPLQKSCLFNGMLFRTKQVKQKITQQKDMRIKHNPYINQLYPIFNQVVKQRDIIICYLNPQLHNQNKLIPPNKYVQQKYTTYLQLKANIQHNGVDIIKLFNPDLILTAARCQPICIYILLFCLKIVMYSHPNIQFVPMLFMQQFIKMQSNQNVINSAKISMLQQVVNVMKFCYSIVLLGYDNGDKVVKQKNEEVVNNCVRNIVQISSINSHILIDAMLVQFGIQINEQCVPLRHNPLIQPNQKQKFKFQVTDKLNMKIIYTLKNCWNHYQQQLLKCINNAELSGPVPTTIQIDNITKKWQQQAINLKSKYFPIPKPNINSTTQNTKLFEENCIIDSNDLIFRQFLLRIRIFSFICYYQILTDILRLGNQKHINELKIKQRKITWEQILEDFMNDNIFQFCTAQLVITILTFDNLVKLSDGYTQNIEDSLNKCVDIWLRTSRDPRAMYQPFISNYWIVQIIKILVDLKVKNQGNPFTNTIYQVRNIVQCLFSNQGAPQYGKPNQLSWILSNLPIGNISGIFYRKNQLLLSSHDQQSESLYFKNSNVLLDNPSCDLSSKSNYSQSMSHTSSSLSKTRKRQRNRALQNAVLSKNKALRNGVYLWGKGINCGPLPYPYAKNLQVLKIACGNYHVVIATTDGIFGWGQNGSGQLGSKQNKQNVLTIKMILSRYIPSGQKVSISCGNQHTAILFKQQGLVMFGQPQGGITSGNGHKFDSVSCGGLHTLGIKNGIVYSWGRGEGGQLGHKPQELKTKIKQQSTDFYLDSPKAIQKLPFIKKSICGDAHSVLLSQSGDVFVFGFSYQGQLGLGLTGESDAFQIFEPVQLKIQNKLTRTLHKFADIFAGSTFTFFKTTQGEIYCCGLNDCNQLGMQRMMKVFQKKKYLGQQKHTNEKKMGQIQFSRPKKIEIFNNQIKVNQIYCGQNHCLASVQYLKKNKMVMGWGLNKQFQISSQFSNQNLTPRTIDNIYEYNFSQLCCGSNFSVGLIKNQNRLTLRQLQQRIQILIQNSIVLNFTY